MAQDYYTQGYYLVFREHLNLPIFPKERYTKVQAWNELIGYAAYKNTSEYRAGEKVIVKRGEIITSKRELADRWLWSKNTVTRFLDQLKKYGLINYTSNRKGTLIEIVNYDAMQKGIDLKKLALEPPSDPLKGTPIGTPQPQYLQGIAENQGTLKGTPMGHQVTHHPNPKEGHQNTSNIEGLQEIEGHQKGHHPNPKVTHNNKTSKVINSVCVIEPTTESKLLFSTEVYNQLCIEYGKEETDCRIHEMLLWASDNQTTIQNPRKMFKGWKCKHKPTGEQSNKQAGTTTPTQRKTKSNQFTNFSQRDYDINALEKKLLAN